MVIGLCWATSCHFTWSEVRVSDGGAFQQVDRACCFTTELFGVGGRSYHRPSFGTIWNTVEVLTNQGKEFLGAFGDLRTKALIDHRTTSRDHPEADGLAERVVQTTKRGLRKYELLQGGHRDWDLMLPWIAMAIDLVGRLL